jgi:hypothetical protein
MARKPRSEWSEAYRKRVERAERLGKTRQESRGHKPGEAAVRAAGGAKRIGSIFAAFKRKVSGLLKGLRGKARKAEESRQERLFKRREIARQERELNAANGQLSPSQRRFARRVGREFQQYMPEPALHDPRLAGDAGENRMIWMKPRGFRIWYDRIREIRDQFEAAAPGDWEVTHGLIQYLAEEFNDKTNQNYWYYYH